MTETARIERIARHVQFAVQAKHGAVRLGVLLLLGQFAFPSQALAEWVEVLPCTREIYFVRIGAENVVPGQQVTFRPGSIAVKCASRGDSSTVDEGTFKCSKSENRSMTIHWDGSTVAGRCNPLPPQPPPEEELENSENAEKSEGAEEVN